ncbi:secreted frizzled-related protein 3-like [Aplysia californica]|uniref:Secreted frizzled-related protein 3-like n=1 Tax=Aplysia californica TaxID=6500 RepID=A0ABM0K731_APLCA|nr:secreted frizzled-related protein 3-like [Aplysia californica]
MISRTFLNPVQHMTSRHPLCVVSGALLVIILCCFSTSRAYVTRIEQCEPIEIPRCRAMPYNLTRMPNLVHHSNQVNARLVFEKYEVLIDRHCSDVLLFLLCSIYVPICALTSKSTAVPPCRGVCERARAGCEPLMNAYDVSWPEFLNCSNLPVYEQEMCVIPEAIVKSDGRKKGQL